MEHLNRELFLRINAADGLSGWRLDAPTWIATYAILLVPLLLTGLWLWGNPRLRGGLLLAAAAAMLSLGFNQLVGLAWYHPRPFAMGLGHRYLTHVADSSFPSDHVSVLWAVGLCLAVRGGRRRYGWMLLALSILVGWARVYLGVHFPFDVLGAIVSASIAAAGLNWVWPIAQRRALPIAEALYRRIFAGAIARGWVHP